jgi:hypothetical protein
MDSQQKARVGIYRLCYGGWERAVLGSWLAKTVVSILRDHERIGFLDEEPFDKAPVYASRNSIVKRAQELKLDYIVMCDNDQVPDVVPGAPLFWDTAFNFARELGELCVITAPTRMLNGMIAIHRLEVRDGKKHLLLMQPHEVAYKKGVERVAGTGTGLIFIDMAVFDLLTPPYFRFEYTDKLETDVKAGEDILFTADLGGPKVPIYCAWDCWSGHDKMGCIGKPEAKPRVLMP